MLSFVSGEKALMFMALQHNNASAANGSWLDLWGVRGHIYFSTPPDIVILDGRASLTGVIIIALCTSFILFACCAIFLDVMLFGWLLSGRNLFP